MYVCCVDAGMSYPELCVGTCVLMCLGMCPVSVASGCVAGGWVPTCACPVAEVAGCLIHVSLCVFGGEGHIMSTHSDLAEGCWRPQGH